MYFLRTHLILLQFTESTSWFIYALSDMEAVFNLLSGQAELPGEMTQALAL